MSIFYDCLNFVLNAESGKFIPYALLLLSVFKKPLLNIWWGYVHPPSWNVYVFTFFFVDCGYLGHMSTKLNEIVGEGSSCCLPNKNMEWFGCKISQDASILLPNVVRQIFLPQNEGDLIYFQVIWLYIYDSNPCFFRSLTIFALRMEWIAIFNAYWNWLTYFQI